LLLYYLTEVIIINEQFQKIDMLHKVTCFSKVRYIYAAYLDLIRNHVHYRC
jgi:hypothetical protein